jgi:protein O-GlcNAcase / histone acetyltransferase
LETENEDCDENPPNYLTEHTYHPRVALKNAIRDWLPDFFEDKKAFGPMLKPHPAAAVMAPIQPIIPKVNTCMCLTLTTSTSSSTMATPIPEVVTSQLHALADICSTVTVTSDLLIKSSVMNSLVSETKVVTTEAITTPILSSTIIESSVELPQKSPMTVPDIMEVEKNSTEPSENAEEMDQG